VLEYVEGLGQLFCFPRKIIVEFPIHFCLVYLIFNFLAVWFLFQKYFICVLPIQTDKKTTSCVNYRGYVIRCQQVTLIGIFQFLATFNYSLEFELLGK
jgi:hypothetical protein